ncbi:MAG TPA: O-antigen ligase family protein [Allosphingosinicella sp.]|nr:O-antigen ligase family protein [Allosphingosinicella sp.]
MSTKAAIPLAADRSGGARTPDSAPPQAAGNSVNPALYALFLALALTGYPLAGVVTSALGWEGPTISYAYRILVLLLGAILFGQAVLRGRPRLPPVLVLIFFSLYFVRLYYDAFIDPLQGADFAFTFYVSVVLTPCLAMAVATDGYDETRFALSTFWVGFVACVSIALLEAAGWGAGHLEDTGRLSFDALNPITVGFTGLFTLLAIIALWRQRPRLMPVFLIGGAFAIYSIVEAASRGPAAAGAFAIAVLALARRNFLLFAVLLAAGAYFVFFADDASLKLLSRFEGVGTDESSAERLFFMQNAIREALDNPLFGHAYVETVTFQSPHNLIIESGLAIGLLGVAIMVVIYFQIARRAWLLAKAEHEFLAGLLCCAFVNANLSASLWSSLEFWIPVILSAEAARRIKKSRDSANAAIGTAPRQRV